MGTSNTKCKYNCNRGRVFMSALGGWVDCPECKGAVTEARVLNQEIAIDLIEWLKIPEDHEEITPYDCNWGALSTQGYSHTSVETLRDTLTSMNTQIVDGKVAGVLKQNLYLCCDRQLPFRDLVFSMQKRAIRKELRVVPYISANMLGCIKSQRSVNFQQTTIESLLAVSFPDYVFADLCFLYMTAESTDSDWSLLVSLVEERTRLGKGTFVFGYWNSQSVSSRSISGKYALNEELNKSGEFLVPVELKKEGKKAGLQRTSRRTDTPEKTLSSVSKESAGISDSDL